MIGDILKQVHKLLVGFHIYSRIDLQFIWLVVFLDCRNWV
jgi:hypothetical protein